MGNDGGSIPKRGDLVRTKQTRARDSDQDRVRQLWNYCALSKLPLAPPVVACPLGRLYNKDALIAHLLAPSPAESPYGHDGHQVARHIRSLKDVVTLRLTPNPALDPSADDAPAAPSLQGQGETDRPSPAAFVCPVSLREMNGAVRFVHRVPCGCVLSDAALRELRRLAPTGEDGADAPQVCPVDNDDSPGERWVTLNPKGDEAERMRDAWEAQVAGERDEKRALKAAKRKAAGSAGGDEGAPSGKKAKKERAADVGKGRSAAGAVPAVKAGATVPQLSATLAARLAEDKRKQSPAIASLYVKKGEDEMRDKDGRSNWMTIGSYSRF